MRKHSMPEMKEGGVNVTPLIDIVMCLIIFFILVAKIGVSTGIDPTIKNPETYLGVKISDMGNVLALNLYKTGAPAPQIVVDLKGRPKTELKIQEGSRYPLREVLKAMKQERGENFKVVINGGKVVKPRTDPATGAPVVGPDGQPLMDTTELDYEQVSMVLQECAMAGVSNVHFSTKKGTRVIDDSK
jgi:biopolymer transport protein ExbD